MPAALLAANIQALVLTLVTVDPDPVAPARRIDRHLWRHTPNDRYATAVFVLLDRDSGQLQYVNAGHNPAVLFGAGPATRLEPTGFPLGLMEESPYRSVTTLR